MSRRIGLSWIALVPLLVVAQGEAFGQGSSGSPQEDCPVCGTDPGNTNVIVQPPLGRCVQADPPCENEPGKKITFTFTMANPVTTPPKTRRFIICLDLVGVFQEDVAPGQTKIKKIKITTGTATFRLHPKAWCKSFVLPEGAAAAAQLKQAVQQEINQIAQLQSQHGQFRALINAEEHDLVVAIEAQDENAIAASQQEITELENEDNAILNQIEERDNAIVQAYGTPPEATAIFLELTLSPLR